MGLPASVVVSKSESPKLMANPTEHAVELLRDVEMILASGRGG